MIDVIWDMETSDPDDFLTLLLEHGEWGARLSPNSRTWIITDYDHEKFVKILTMC
jgi:hypothetical protein